MPCWESGLQSALVDLSESCSSPPPHPHTAASCSAKPARGVLAWLPVNAMVAPRTCSHVVALGTPLPALFPAQRQWLRFVTVRPGSSHGLLAKPQLWKVHRLLWNMTGPTHLTVSGSLNFARLAGLTPNVILEDVSENAQFRHPQHATE